ncbi:MAG: TonB family protein [Terriglobales bacterium]
MASKESNLENRTASAMPELELKQRRRMLAALAVLLTALIVVIIRDRQFWFPPSPEPVAIEQTPAPASPVTVPQTETAPPAATPLKASPSKTRRGHGKHSPASTAQAAPDSRTAVPPIVSTTTRAVLPPLDIEVVAGNQHRTLNPRSNSVKVDMQPSAPADAGSAASTPVPEASQSTAQVSMSAPTAERVSRSVSPNYPLLAKQMKVQGAVVLQALIDKAGKIEDLHVISGPAILSAAAQEAVKQWHFKPYYQGGLPVETEARITVNFTISTY